MNRINKEINGIMIFNYLLSTCFKSIKNVMESSKKVQLTMNSNAAPDIKKLPCMCRWKKELCLHDIDIFLVLLIYNPHVLTLWLTLIVCEYTSPSKDGVKKESSCLLSGKKFTHLPSCSLLITSHPFLFTRPFRH